MVGFFVRILYDTNPHQERDKRSGQEDSRQIHQAQGKPMLLGDLAFEGRPERITVSS